MVSTWLRDNDRTYHRNAISPKNILSVCSIKFCITHISKSNYSKIILNKNKIIKIFGRLHQTHCTNRLLNIITLNTTGRQLNIFSIQSILNIHWSNIKRSHPYRIQPQAHSISILTPNLNRTNVRYSLQTLLHS